MGLCRTSENCVVLGQRLCNPWKTSGNTAGNSGFRYCFGDNVSCSVFSFMWSLVQKNEESSSKRLIWSWKWKVIEVLIGAESCRKFPNANGRCRIVSKNRVGVRVLDTLYFENYFRTLKRTYTGYRYSLASKIIFQKVSVQNYFSRFVSFIAYGEDFYCANEA